MNKTETFQSMGKAVTCPVCGNNTALEESDSWMCATCGYMTTALYRKGSPALRNVLSTSPQLIIDKQFFDEERSLVWIPTVIQMPAGMIYPEEQDDGELIWRHAKVIQIPEKEQSAFPVPGQENKFYDSRLDVDNADKFDRFYDALISIGAVIRIDELENELR